MFTPPRLPCNSGGRAYDTGKTMINNSNEQEEINGLQSKIYERYIDKALQTSISLWSALITVNGILIAISPILTSLLKYLDRSITNLIIIYLICCLSSLALLVYNFAAFQKFYFKLGEACDEDFNELRKKEFEKLLQRTYRSTKFADRVAKVLFFSELALICSIFYFTI